MTQPGDAANQPEYLAADELVGDGEDFLDPFNLTKRLGACTLCGAMVPEATEQLHTDWHKALGK